MDDEDFVLGVSQRRVTHTWLPTPQFLTVLGRLEERDGVMTMVKDPRFGLLLSPFDSKAASNSEWYKGWFGIAAIACILVAAAFYFFVTVFQRNR